jgi:hypothetical protein
MYVFSIDILFKGSQSLAKMMSQATAVSYLHSGVYDSTVHITVVSMTLLCMSQRCQWLRCDMHSGVNDYTEIFSKFAYLHSGVNDSAVLVIAKSDFWWVFFKLWIHKIWEVSLWFVLIGFTPRICYIKGGVVPQVKPGVWHPKICAQLWLTVGSMTPLNFYQNLHHGPEVSMTPLCISQRCQWLCCAHHRDVHDSALHVTAASMTPLC